MECDRKCGGCDGGCVGYEGWEERCERCKGRRGAVRGNVDGVKCEGRCRDPQTWYL